MDIDIGIFDIDSTDIDSSFIKIIDISSSTGNNSIGIIFTGTDTIEIINIDMGTIGIDTTSIYSGFLKIIGINSSIGIDTIGIIFTDTDINGYIDIGVSDTYIINNVISIIDIELSSQTVFS